MKINVNGGHCPKAPGASKYLDELKEDRLIKDELIKQLKLRGHSVTDSTSNAANQYDDLAYQANKANSSGAELAVSIHLNAGGGTGSECYYYPGDQVGLKKSADVARNLSKLMGIPNRGAKASSGLYWLNNTNMTAILVEVCFVDSTADANAYKKVGYKKVAAAIADAVCGTNKGVMCSGSTGEWVKKNGKWWYKHPDGSYTKSDWEKINGKWYWFDSEGWMVSNCCRKIKNKWYAFDKSGAMIEGKVNLDKNGAMYL